MVKAKPGSKSRDEFKLSYGNLKVLQLIPEMMEDVHWRKKIRAVVFDYVIGKNLEEQNGK